MPNLCLGCCAPQGWCFCSCTQFCNQVQVLQWKNRQIRLRRWRSLLLEVVIPVLLVLALGGLRALVKSVTTPEDIPSLLEKTNLNFDMQYTNNLPQGSGENLVFRCIDPKAVRRRGGESPKYTVVSTDDAMSKCQVKKIAIVAGSGDSATQPTAQDMVTKLNSQYGNNISSSIHKNWNFNSFVYFSSPGQLDAYVRDPMYIFNYNATTHPLIGAAVVVNSGYPAWDYTVRLNVTTIYYGNYIYYDTSDPDIDLSQRTNGKYPTDFGSYSDVYFANHYVALTDVVNTYIASDACTRQNSCPTFQPALMKENWQKYGAHSFVFYTAGSANFPAPQVTEQGFFSLLGNAFALLLICALCYPLANVVSILVKEKESKIREGMKMMSLRVEALWLSWWFYFLEFFAILAIICVIFSKMLFKFSDSFLIFELFFFFMVASVALGIFIAGFFTNSRTAVIVYFLIYIGGYFIFVGLESNATLKSTRAQRLAACLHPSAALTYATLSFGEYEDSGLGVTNFTYATSEKYNISFSDCLGFMVLDAFYLSFLAWYVDKIWPSEFGTQEPWYFVFTLTYWLSVFEGVFGSVCSKRNCGLAGSAAANYSRIVAVSEAAGTSDPEMGIAMQPGVLNSQPVVALGMLPSSDPNVEGVSEALNAQVSKGQCVFIQGLYKEFETPQGGRKVAVNNLNLTMYSGQITALLGHNGAGKTTTIAMLTGLLPVGGGDAFIEGRSVATEMDEIRRNLGVCPQHDILFPELTVEEHLILFASFKGLKGKAIDEEVEKMIQSVGLVEKRRVYSSQLSGGQKRKLSVGIAFIGGSRIVFLDEPTSGMDPYSRRFTWNVIRQHREGRVVVLTTHFMDEADLLGDRIAIMGDGKLLCCGSSLFLKQRFGVGYNMTLEKKNAVSFNSSLMINAVVSRVPEAKLLTDVGTEISFQLPFGASSSFQGLFEHIDVNLDSFGLESYGVSVTTLEEVFIKLTRSTHTLLEAQDGKDKGENVKQQDLEKQQLQQEAAEASLIDPSIIVNSTTLGFRKLPESDNLSYFLRHMHAIFTKRALYFVRDKTAILFVIVLPFLFLLVGEIILTQTPSTFPDAPFKSMSYSTLNPKVRDSARMLPFAHAKNATTCVYCGVSGCYKFGPKNSPDPYCTELIPGQPGGLIQKIMDNVGGSSGIKFPVTGVPYVNSIKGMSRYLMDHRTDFEASQYGAVTFVNTSASHAVFRPPSWGFVIHTNFTACYGVPVFGALLADAVTRTFDPSTSVKVSLHPLPYTFLEHRIDNFNLIFVTIFLLFAVSFIPAAAASFVVREREAKSKNQQFVSGVGIVAYWLANFLWDNAIYMITLFLFVALIAGPAFGQNAGRLGGDGHMYELQYLFGLLYLFGFSMFGFTYLVSFTFRTPVGAMAILILIVFFVGVVLGIIGSFILRILPDSKDAYKNVVRGILCLFPPYALADGVNSMVFIQIYSSTELQGMQSYKAGDYEIAGMPLMMMGWESVVYLLLTMLLEYVVNIPSFLSLLCPSSALPPLRDDMKDADVLAEEERVRSGAADTDSSILVKDFKKMYGTGKYAVKGVSLGIPTGECFGLLGINGAGKSTTLSMLSGEFPPTSGEAYLAGLNLLTDIHTCRRKIGFCPQFDALFEFLTGREHLELYARIKGIVEEDVTAVVNAKISEMGLTEYADRYAGTYSGGNKRKLSVAIAMIGDPSIVFLDEPSTGMDPVARRFMWDVISSIVTREKKCSLILTTHSMEECEALCTRISIMVGGVLRCLGSAQHLRTLYGNGLQIELSLQLPSPEEVHAREVQMTHVEQSDGVKIITEKLIRESLPGYLLARISPEGSGADIYYAINSTSSRTVELSLVAGWLLLEDSFDVIDPFLRAEFGDFELVERQNAKLRIKIDAKLPDGSLRKLSAMFGALERHKDALKISSYSISQTSLEAIFNSFAAKQDEEQLQGTNPRSQQL